MSNDDDQYEPAAPAERISKRATGPSRSQRRREALDVLQLALALMAAPAGLLAKLQLDEDLTELVAESRRINSHGARKRQAQFLAKHLRRLDNEELEAIRAVLDTERSQAMREAAQLHRLETLRTRLIEGGDPVLTEVGDACPDADRSQLRHLMRQARIEHDSGAPPRASRELFRVLRELDWPAAVPVATEAAGDVEADIDIDESTGAADDSGKPTCA